MGDRKFRKVEESELWICVIKKRFVGEDGRNYMKVEWIKVDGEINLGSLVSPNKEVVKIKYRFIQKMPDFLSEFFK